MENITIVKTLGAFSLHLYREGKAKSTEQAYIRDIEFFRNFLKSELNNKIRYINQISLIETRQYKDYLLNLIEEEGIKRTTISRKFNALKTYYNFLEQECGIENLIKNDKFGNKKTSTSERNYLPDILDLDDIQIVLKTIEISTNKNKYRDYAIFQLLINLGCRRSEILELKWNDIDFYRNTIQITREKTNNANLLPLSKSIKESLLQYRDTLEKTGEYIFQSRESDKLSISTFTTTINKWIRESEIEKKKGFKVTAHTFRHSFITSLVRNNVPAEKIIKFTGHKDKSSLEIYIHLNHTDLDDVNNLIENMFR